MYLPLEASGQDPAEESDKELEEMTPSAAHDTVEASPASPATTPGQGGHTWHADVIPDGVTDSKHCLPSGELKSRRPFPQIRVSELLAGIKLIDGKWIFAGPLNGWPALVGLELRGLTRKVSILGMKHTKRIWEGGPTPPKAEDILAGTRANLRAPSWSSIGWSPDSPGFVWWFSDRDGTPQLAHGEKLIPWARRDKDKYEGHAVSVHAFAHRYPVEKETWRDAQTYHTAVFVEWDHRKHGTVIELAWKNGCGGYGGKSNWCEDKLNAVTNIDNAMPDGLKGPWDTGASEIRLIDHPARDKSEFQEFLTLYSSCNTELPFSQHRFLEPQIYASGAVRLRSNSCADIAGHMLNYIDRAGEYTTLGANCQTFTADLFGFLTGTKGVEPWGALVRPGYKQRAHSFLYLPKRGACTP